MGPMTENFAVTPRQFARMLALVRIGIGVSAIIAPDLPARPWVGRSDPTAVKTLARALGGRDIALGLGVLAADATGQPARLWVLAGALADALDVVATRLTFAELPRVGRWLVITAAGAGAVAGVAAAALLPSG
jgi:hypothetical protein